MAPAGTSFYRVTSLSDTGVESSPSPTASASMTRANLLVNPSFENDANADSRPDSWTSNARFLRDAAEVRGGTVSGMHSSTANASYTINQTVQGLTPASTYALSGWVRIPATTDTFSIRFQIQWRNSANTILSTVPATTYSAATNGWVELGGSYVAPANATRATVGMVVSSLNARIYVDDLALR